MRHIHRICFVAFCAILACARPAFASGESQEGNVEDRAVQSNRAARVQLLAADVKEIAGSSMLSRAKKEKRIATAVRVAVVAATAYRHDAGEILGIALELTAAAAHAAPAYAEVIANAVSFSPALTKISGAPGEIRAAAYSAAKGRRSAPLVRTAATEEPAARPRREDLADVSAEPAPRPHADDDNPATQPVHRHIGTAPISAGQSVDSATNMASVTEPAGSSSPGIELGDNSSLNLTATAGIRHDDNVFLSNVNKTGDTIISATPAADFQFGRNSLAHGSLGYQEAFNRYLGRTAPNVSLGTGTGNFGYDDGGIAAVLNGSYQQYYQSNPDTLVLGQTGLIRSNVVSLDGNVETQLGAKMSVKVGANLNSTHYVTPGFIDGRYVGVPVNWYFKATPKVDLSVGYTYAEEIPGGGGPKGRDNYYNLGARGSFTPKLTGSFSAGYQTRTVAATPAQHLFAFSSAFDYQVTAKTTATLSATRNFGASALGQSTKNSAYTLGLNSELTPQWQVGANLSYQDNDYGGSVFTVGNSASASTRQDHYWQGGLLVSYLYSQWLSTSASYTLRNNHSTIQGLEFSDNILSLTVGLRY